MICGVNTNYYYTINIPSYIPISEMNSRQVFNIDLQYYKDTLQVRSSALYPPSLEEVAVTE